MRKLITLLLVLMMTAGLALASEPANPADPAMVAKLLPGYTFVEGIDDGDVLRLLMRNPAKELVFVGGVAKDGSWRFTESTPLPDGTILGVENFTHSLGIPNGTYYDAISLHPYADGTWGVSLIYPNSNGMIIMDQHLIHAKDEAHEIYGTFGDHPWSDITLIDWASLPQSYEEAIAALDSTDWAVVNNPSPEDRLHLRASPNQDAASYGKYYNRTPVRIREYGDDWCAVTVCGLDGYMMTKYLAFGTDMAAVDYAGPWLGTGGNYCPTHPVPNTDAEGIYIAPSARFYIMGVVADFCHVWFPDTEEYAYILSSFLTPGNG